MTAAKIRLRLYAGLNEWALENLFAPRPGAIANCQASSGCAASDCEALLAAAGRMGPAQASRIGAGAPMPWRPQAAAPAGQPAPARRQAAPLRQLQREHNTGCRGYGAQPAYGAQRQGWGAQQQPAAATRLRRAAGVRRAARSGLGRAATAGTSGLRRVQHRRASGSAGRCRVGRRPAARRAAPRPAVAARRRRARRRSRAARPSTQRQRQEYLDRKKAEMEARKTKIVATAGGTERVQRGPASVAEAEAAGIDPAQIAAAPARQADAHQGCEGRGARAGRSRARGGRRRRRGAAGRREEAAARQLVPRGADGRPARQVQVVQPISSNHLASTRVRTPHSGRSAFQTMFCAQAGMLTFGCRPR